jgi:hypothetical protein
VPGGGARFGPVVSSGAGASVGLTPISASGKDSETGASFSTFEDLSPIDNMATRMIRKTNRNTRRVIFLARMRRSIAAENVQAAYRSLKF